MNLNYEDVFWIHFLNPCELHPSEYPSAFDIMAGWFGFI